MGVSALSTLRCWGLGFWEFRGKGSYVERGSKKAPYTGMRRRNPGPEAQGFRV